ncbi:MAG TPA: hypothetical protein VFI95_17130 [Terriglobales bacterium]|nr:hypothetical protein [Terriglobales bacterium]
MKRVAVCPVILALATTVAVAQSSASFSADIVTTSCAIDNNGALTGGNQSPGNILDTYVQPPSSSSTALLIRPSLVTGLFTDTKLVSGGSNTSTAATGVRIFVMMDGKPVAPDTGKGVVYEERFQQLSSNLRNQITSCLDSPTATTSSPCYFDLLQSTLSAHSMDFVAPSVGGGTHHLQVSWEVVNVPTSNGTVASCVGPGSLTVEQVKNFSQNSVITIQ